VHGLHGRDLGRGAGAVESTAMPTNILAQPGFLLSKAIGSGSGRSSPSPTPRSQSPVVAPASAEGPGNGSAPSVASIHASGRSNPRTSPIASPRSGSVGSRTSTRGSKVYSSLHAAPSFVGSSDSDPVSSYVSASPFERARFEEQLAKWTREERVAFFRAVSQRRALLDMQL
jgi:hypothetical protein